MFTNFVVLLTTLNLALYAAFAVVHRISAPHHKHFKRPAPSKVRPGWTREQATELSEETKAVLRLSGREYDDITQLRPLEFHGRYINIASAGFRLGSNQGPWPPDPSAFNVFVFGGSTVFGVGVEDGATIPSRLQQALNSQASGRRINVYNFGRVGYASTQEMLLFLSLVRNRFVPQTAIFVDGLNDCTEWTLHPPVRRAESDKLMQLAIAHAGAGPDMHARRTLQIPPHQRWIASFINASIRQSQIGPTLTLIRELPMGRLALAIRSEGEGQSRSRIAAPPSNEEIIKAVVGQWLNNRDAITALANFYGVKPVFVWQPTATYKYDLRYDLYGASPVLERQWAVPVVYPAVDAMADGGLMGNNFVDLSGLQQEHKENLYVDPAHYTPAFSKEIAERVAAFMRDTHTL